MSESTAFYSQTHLFSGNIVAAIGRINEELARKITLVSLYIKDEWRGLNLCEELMCE